MNLNKNRKKLSLLLGTCPTVESEYLFAFGTELAKNTHPKLALRKLLLEPDAAPFHNALHMINTAKRKSLQNPFSVFVPDMILVGFETRSLGPLVLNAASIIRKILDLESKNLQFDDEAILSAIDFYLHVVKTNAGPDPDFDLKARADSLLHDAIGIGFGS